MPNLPTTTSESKLRTRVGIDDGDPWPSYTFPGAYPIVYIADDSEVICSDCMNRESECIHFDGHPDGWLIIGADVYYEGPDDYCAHCNAVIPSAYGDPYADEADGE